MLHSSLVVLQLLILIVPMALSQSRVVMARMMDFGVPTDITINNNNDNNEGIDRDQVTCRSLMAVAGCRHRLWLLRSFRCLACRHTCRRHVQASFHRSMVVILLQAHFHQVCH
jgi:hypothetical protein